MELSKILTWTASPLGVFAWTTLISWLARHARGAWAERMRAAGAIAGATGAIQLVAFACFPVADGLVRPLETRALQLAAQAPRDEYAAILVLGGILQPPPQESNAPPELSAAVDRLWLAARLHRSGLAPRIVVSGGSRPSASGVVLVPEAESMKQVLVELGVPSGAIVAETRSLNTRENITESSRKIGSGARVALVTSAFHMPRALSEARAAGLDAHAFPADFLVPPDGRVQFQNWLPNPDALVLSTLAIKEHLGMLALAVGI